MIGLLLGLIVVGIVLYYVPMDARIRQLVYILAVLCVALSLLGIIWSLISGVWGFPHFR